MGQANEKGSAFPSRKHWFGIAVLILFMTSIYVQQTGVLQYLVESNLMPASIKGIGSQSKQQTSGESRFSHQGKQKRKPAQKKLQQVILLTYGRSGSTYLANIIKQDPNVLSNFEPLLKLARTFTEKQTKYAKEHNGSHLHLVTIPEYLKQAEQIVESWMMCDYMNLPRLAYKNNHLGWNNETAKLRECLWDAGIRERAVHRCLKAHGKKCKKKPTQFLKIIRLPVESVGRLMAKHPKLKMIFLSRDPRGSFLSKKKTFVGMLSNDTHFEAERFCVRLVKDVKESFKLYQKFPGRVFITRFESIAAKPMLTGQQLYKFLNLNFTPAIAKYIQMHTMSNDTAKNNDPYSTLRSNSKATSYKWRSTIPFADAKRFDELCHESNKLMGYLPVKSEEHLRNFETPIKISIDHVV